MFTKEAILKALEENMKEIREFGVKKLGLFGSFVRGEQKDESDIDILVEFEKGKKPLTIIWNSNFSSKICLNARLI